MAETLERVLRDHPFFRDLRPEFLEVITGCAANVRFPAGARIFTEGEEANRFYLIRGGKVAIEVFAPGRHVLTIQTLEEGDVLGWSWLFPPHRWHFDARAMEEVRALALDGKCLREKCEQDHDLGYELMKRFSAVMVERLQATRLQLLDIHGGASGTAKLR